MNNERLPANVGSNDGLGAGGGELTGLERAVLSCLHYDAGSTTGDLAQTVVMTSAYTLPSNQRRASAAVLQVMYRLEAMGLATRLDNELPIAWVRKAPNAQVTGQPKAGPG